MARNLTVAQLIDRAKKRMDMENSDVLSDAEWQENLSTVYGELYEEVADSGMRYFETEATIVADGSASYALPSDHLSTIAVDGEVSVGGNRYPLRESMVQERNAYTGSASSGRACEYALVGDTLKLYPAPSSGNYFHTYIQQVADLSEVDTGTSVDVFTASGEKFVVFGLVILARTKEQDSIRDDLAQQQQALAKLRKWVVQRSFNTPRRPVAEDVGGTSCEAPGHGTEQPGTRYLRTRRRPELPPRIRPRLDHHALPFPAVHLQLAGAARSAQVHRQAHGRELPVCF